MVMSVAGDVASGGLRTTPLAVALVMLFPTLGSERRAELDTWVRWELQAKRPTFSLTALTLEKGYSSPRAYVVLQQQVQSPKPPPGAQERLQYLERIKPAVGRFFVHTGSWQRELLKHLTPRLQYVRFVPTEPGFKVVLLPGE